MIIEIDTKSGRNLNPNQQVFLQQLLNKEDPIEISDDEKRTLFSLGYLNPQGELVRSKVIQEFLGNEEEFFYELFDAYPQKVTDKFGGIRILRPATYKNKHVQALKEKYNQSVKTLDKHRYVMKCLQNEKKSRDQSDSNGFWQALETYINQQSWDKYANETPVRYERKWS